MRPTVGGRPGGARALGRVAAQGHQVMDAGIDVGVEDALELGAGVADAGQVRHRGQRGLASDPTGDLDRGVAGRATGAVGDRDERRLVGLELVDRLPEPLGAGVVLRREELKGDRALAVVDQLSHAAPATRCHGREVRALTSERGYRRRLLGRRRIPHRARRDHGRIPRPAGCAARPAGPGRRSPAGRGPGGGGRWQEVPGRFLPLGLPRRRARRPSTRPHCCGPAPRSSCCTPAPWPTTT